MYTGSSTGIFLEAAGMATLSSEGNLPWCFGVGGEPNWAALWNFPPSAAPQNVVKSCYALHLHSSGHIGGLKNWTVRIHTVFPPHQPVITGSSHDDCFCDPWRLWVLAMWMWVIFPSCMPFIGKDVEVWDIRAKWSSRRLPFSCFYTYVCAVSSWVSESGFVFAKSCGWNLPSSSRLTRFLFPRKKIHFFLKEITASWAIWSKRDFFKHTSKPQVRPWCRSCLQQKSFSGSCPV